LSPEIFGSEPGAVENAIAELLQSDDQRVSHIVIAPQTPVLTPSQGEGGIPAATVHQPSIRASGA
jgi:hypothetical protein